MRVEINRINVKNDNPEVLDDIEESNSNHNHDVNLNNEDNIDLSAIQNHDDEDILGDDETPEQEPVNEQNEEIQEQKQPMTKERNIMIKKLKLMFSKPRLLRYIQHRAAELEYIDYLPDEQLKELLESLKDDIATMSTCQNIEGFAKGISFVGEKLACQYTPLDLEGFTEIFMKDENVLTCIDEISVDCVASMRTDPMTRLALSALQMGSMVHVMNKKVKAELKQSEQYNKMKNEQVDEETLNKYKDL